jgi:hypothetical protein
MQKNRNPIEGVFLGLLFGPFGVLVAALLPTQAKMSGQTGRANKVSPKLTADELSQVIYLENRYLELIDQAEPNWRELSYHKRKAVLKRIDRYLIKEVKLTRTQFANLSIEAKRSILQT